MVGGATSQLSYCVYCFLLRTQLTQVSDQMMAVQECYISVCKEKDMLEENILTNEV